MRTPTTQELAVQTSPQRRLAFRVWVKSAAGAYVDFSALAGINWCTGVSYGSDSEQPCATATVKLRRDFEQISLAPLVSASMLNQGSVAIDVKRGIKIEVATVPDDPGYAIQAADWENVFEGQVDEVEPASGRPGDGSVIVLQCRDLAARLQDTWVEHTGRPDGSAYGTLSGGRAMETVAQDLLDDVLGAGVETVYTPNGSDATPINAGDLSGWMIKQWVPDKQSLLDALKILANQIGYDIRYRWSTLSSPAKWRLEIFNPPRAKVVSDGTITVPQYKRITRAGIRLDPVRNFIEVSYQTDPNKPTTRTSVTASDATSITRYGRRWMCVSEDASSAINTATEGNKMAAAILADIKDPKLEHAAECEFLYQYELYDLVTFKADGVDYDTDQQIAVAAISHELDAKTARTTIVGGGSVRGAYTAWQAIAGTAGGPPTKNTWGGPVLAPPATSQTVGGAIIKPADSLFTTALDHYEVHVSTVSGFTPDASTLQAQGKSTRYEITGLDPRLTYYTKLVPVFRDGLKGAATAQSSVGPGQATAPLIATAAIAPQHLTPEAAFSGNMIPNANFSSFTNGITSPPDGWSVVAGTWNSASSIEAVTTPLLSGGHAIHFNTVGGRGQTNGLVSQLFPVIEGHVYMSGAEIYLSAGGANHGDPILYVNWYDANKAALSSTLMHSSGGGAGAYYRAYGTVTAPAGARYASYQIGSQDGVSLSNDNYFDNVWMFEQTDFGTGFPALPFTGQQFFRTDRGIPYYYDGTRWLSTQIFEHYFSPTDALMPASATGALMRSPPLNFHGGSGAYVLDVTTACWVNTANTSLNCWTAQVFAREPAGASTQFGGTLNTSNGGQGAGGWGNQNLTGINLAYTNGHFEVEVVLSKVGAPGTIYMLPVLRYRAIG